MAVPTGFLGFTTLLEFTTRRTAAALVLGVGGLFASVIPTGARQGAQQPHSSQPARALDTCGRADPSHLRVANESGGQPLFLKPSEAGRVGQFLREMSGNNHETLMWATGPIGRGREFTVPVDGTVDRVTFSLSVDGEGGALDVRRPSGVAIRKGDPDTEMTELSCTRIVTVLNPDIGDWRVGVSGPGRFWLQVGAKTEIFLVSTQFVKVGGRPGHEGLFRIDGQPLAGTPATLRLTLSGPVDNAEFSLVALDGDVIGSVALREESPSSDTREYAGTFALPPRPFRVAVRGANANGQRYQRLFHTLFHAETVEIRPADGAPDEVARGATSPIAFTIRNVGAPASFHIIAVDGRQFISRTDPADITLGTGVSARITVDLTVPADVAEWTGFDLTVTATSTSGPNTSNGAVRHITVRH